MIVAALLNAFAKTEEEFLRISVDAKEFSGACANVILIYRDTIYVANLGDCRAVLGRSKAKAIGLSRDHKASIEKSRIRKVGGFIKNGRVNGILAISRTIGDREFKDPVAMSSSPNGSPIITSSHFSSRPGQSSRPGSSPNAVAAASASMTRRVSNPSNIVLKNVRENSDSPARSRLRNSTSLLQNPSSPSINGGESGPAAHTLSKSAIVDGTSSRDPSPSPIPFSVVPTAVQQDRSSLAVSAGSLDSGSSEGKSKKRRSTPTPKKSRPHSRSGSATNSENSESSLLPIQQEEDEDHPSKEGEENKSADTNDDSITETVKTPIASPQPSKAGKRSSGNAPSPSPPPAAASNNLAISSSTSSEGEVARKAKKDKDLGSSSESVDSEGNEAVEGMFDVIECYDAESKQKKFGFKKRRPPKDPKYDTATVVSAIPEITIMRRTAEDDYIFLASDGFYDLFTSKQAGIAVSKHLSRCGRDKLTDTVKCLCEEASLLGSEDDITGVLILMKPIPEMNGSNSSSSLAVSSGNLMAGSSEPPM